MTHFAGDGNRSATRRRLWTVRRKPHPRDKPAPCGCQRSRSLCDVLSSFSFQGKATLHELCRVMGLPGKEGMRGDEVEKYHRDGHIREIAEYCESDVINTYRVWLRHELFRGRLSDADFHSSVCAASIGCGPAASP